MSKPAFRRDGYLMRMSFLTDVTPLMPMASWTARDIDDCELTKPLSCTTPLNVSTLTSVAFTCASSANTALTFVVIQLSVTYSPVPSCVGVDMQPVTDNRRAARATAEKRLSRFIAE